MTRQFPNEPDSGFSWGQITQIGVALFMPGWPAKPEVMEVDGKSLNRGMHFARTASEGTIGDDSSNCSAASILLFQLIDH